jgi:hypothetical protein
MQRHIHATVFDGIMAGWAIQDDIDATGPSIDNMYCLGNGGAPYAADTGLTIKNLRGLVLQRTADSVPIGTDPQFLSYYLEDDEYSSTLAAVTTDPRWDIVCIKLEQESADAADQELRDFEDALTRELTTSNVIKKRKVKATIQVVTGTEDVSPVEPATPAGFVKIAAFQVRFGETEFDPKLDIRDYRVPVGFREYHTIGRNFGYLPADWTESYLHLVSVTGSGEIALSECPVAGGGYRVMAVGYGLYYTTGTPAVRLCRLDYSKIQFDGILDGVFTVEDLTPTSGWAIAVPTLPLWANGYAAGYAVDKTQFSGTGDANITGLPESAGLRILSQGGDTVRVIGSRFYICG